MLGLNPSLAAAVSALAQFPPPCVYSSLPNSRLVLACTELVDWVNEEMAYWKARLYKQWETDLQ